MPTEYSYEIRERAEDLYVVDGRTFEQVAEETGVSVSQLKRWSAESNPPWTDARREYRAALSSIRRDTVLAKAKLIKSVVETMDPQKAYAFSSLISADRAINQAMAQAAEAEMPEVAVETMTGEEMVAALGQVISRKVNTLLTSPSGVNFKDIKEITGTMQLLDKAKRELAADAAEKVAKQGGLSQQSVQELRRAILGVRT